MFGDLFEAIGGAWVVGFLAACVVVGLAVGVVVVLDRLDRERRGWWR
jgi:hypothetical protein